MTDLRQRVLVVDDTEENRKILVRRLKRHGVETAEAENGEVALQLLRTAEFDLLLLDIMMPVMDGFQVLEHMRADPRLRKVPVIVISAANDLDNVVRCIQLGADDYLNKPFNPVVLKARVNACLEKKASLDRERDYLAEIEAQKARTDELLRVILPPEIIDELKQTGSVKPKAHDHIAVLFADVVGFTKFCAQETPERVLEDVQKLVHSFEDVCVRHHIHKTKTIGDCFMATAGLFSPMPNPAHAMVQAGVDMIAALRQCVPHWQVRIGVHVGAVISGVVGQRQYLFDIWGDTVNMAQRVEQNGVPGSVVVSEAAYNEIKSLIPVEFLGEVDVKNKGAVKLFRII